MKGENAFATHSLLAMTFQMNSFVWLSSALPEMWLLSLNCLQTQEERKGSQVSFPARKISGQARNSSLQLWPWTCRTWRPRARAVAVLTCLLCPPQTLLCYRSFAPRTLASLHNCFNLSDGHGQSLCRWSIDLKCLYYSQSNESNQKHRFLPISERFFPPL